MEKHYSYERKRIGKYIIISLQKLGGSASKQKIKEEIVADESNNITYKDVFIPIKSSKSGNEYIPFNFDFNFGLKELLALGYIEKYNRTTDIVLTEAGRKANVETFPNEKELSIIEEYWEIVHQNNKADINPKNEKYSSDQVTEDDKKEDDLLDKDQLQVKLLELIKKFTPKKFESFSRTLLSKMGIEFDNKKGIMMSNDHGIDGYGVFEADDFRTYKVVIQCKRYTDGCVGEPDIDKFRGVISKHSADYGIFITTSYFSENAKLAARQVNPTITLIDGQRLVDLIIKYNLRVKTTQVTYFNIEEYYNEKD